MKLSMYMIAEWMKGYQPLAVIRSGERAIVGARLFTDNADISGDYLYVGRNEDFLGGASSETLIMFREDVLSIQSDDVNRIFNEVLSAFDFYDALETRLLTAASRPDPEQGILTACQELIGPSFIYSNDFKMLAFSHNYVDVYVNEFWENVVLGNSSVSERSILDGKTLMDLTSGRHSMLEFYESTASPYGYGLYNSYCDANDQVIGFVVISSTKPVSPFERDIAQIMMTALRAAQESVETPRRLDAAHSPDAMMLSRLLGDEDPEQAVEYLESMKSIRDGMEFMLLVTTPASPNLLKALQADLNGAMTDRVVLRQERQLVVLVWNRSAKRDVLPARIQARVAPQCQRAAVGVGASNPFVLLADAARYLPQAQTASEAASGDGEVVPFRRVAVDYLFSTRSRELKLAARHPAVAALEGLDRENDAELVATLREYLLCERSTRRAAAKLFVHRNTVLYRVDQAKGLGLFDLDDDDERAYLLLSLLLTGRGEDEEPSS